MNKKYFLFINQSFIKGISKTLDVGVTSKKYDTSRTGEELDLIALQSDWEAVSRDISEAIILYGKQIDNKVLY
jgi:hypothetical protein